MNYKLILNILGFLVFITGIFMMLGIPFSIYFGDNDIPALLIAGIGTSLTGFRDVYKRQGSLIVMPDGEIITMMAIPIFCCWGIQAQRE